MNDYQLIVIGGGPAGYPAAAAAVKAGMKTLLIEADTIGGTCLNRGCIPTKSFCRPAEIALDIAHSAEYGIDLEQTTPKIDIRRIVERKNGIVMQLREGVASEVNGADIIIGKARFTAPGQVEVNGQRFSAPKIIIATGASPARLPIPGAELCITSDDMLDLEEIPQSLVIIGGGVIGMEFGSIFSAFGCEVTIVEYCREILPGFDRDIAKRLRSSLSRRGVKFILNAAATDVEKSGDNLTVRYSSKNKQSEIQAAQVLMAVGRRPVVPEGFIEAGGQVGKKGIVVDNNFMTDLPGVYAVGDCNGICQLAHAATAQAKHVMGVSTDLSPVPAAVFTVPEVAMTGMTEELAEQSGLAFRTVKLPVRSNGKANAMGETDGLVKLLISDEGKIIGCHIVGPHASDLIMEASLAMSAGLPAGAITRAIHPHPSLSELLPSALG